jgi:hypothetical protein
MGCINQRRRRKQRRKFADGGTKIVQEYDAKKSWTERKEEECVYGLKATVYYKMQYKEGNTR